MAGKVLRTFTRPALLSCFTTYPFKDLFFIHGRFEHEPKSRFSFPPSIVPIEAFSLTGHLQTCCGHESEHLALESQDLMGLGGHLVFMLDQDRRTMPSCSFVPNLHPFSHPSFPSHTISSRLSHNFCNYYPQIPLSLLFPAYQCRTTPTMCQHRSTLPMDGLNYPILASS